ncbi:MAG: amidohydrolase [Sphingobacteriales bacterium]|nr:amidohydrolase [Sphingobacteriales bacterium]
MKLIARIKHLATQYHADTVAQRRHLHAHPELSFQEHETARYIQSELQKIGVPFQSGIADNGVVALIEGKQPATACIALRADFDALPITEANNVPYKSRNEGVMHACGHDAHTANLLAVTRILYELRHEWQGTVKCIFQPAEEKIPGGASLMIKEGVLENPRPSAIFGQHVHPPLPAGKVGFRAGLAMASADEIHLRVIGKGGHAAGPREFIDPILIASNIIVALQQIVSRRADPTLPTVLSFGKIESVGGYNNVIPDEVHIEGTFRAMNEAWRFEAHEKIRQLAQSIAAGMDGRCEVEILVGYPFLFNNEALTARTKAAALEFLGAENVVDIPLRMGAEDFAYYSHQTDACFYRLGIRNEARGIISNIHTATFDIDEEALHTGVGLMAYLALKELEQEVQNIS